MNTIQNLAWAIEQAAFIQKIELDRLQFDVMVHATVASNVPANDLMKLGQELGLHISLVSKVLDPAYVPFIVFVENIGWGVIISQTAQGEWLVQQSEGTIAIKAEQCQVVGCLDKVDVPLGKNQNGFMHFVRDAIVQYKGILFEAIIATIFINMLALAASLFSMQVYDRVIPTKGYDTLFVLVVGVLFVNMTELAMKFARSKIMDTLIVGLDGQLSREIFQRLLSIRVDQLPGSVGSLAAQIRGYEQIRSFYTASTLFTMVDIPMGLVFLVLIGIIGSFWVVLVPLILLIISLALSFVYRRRTDRLAQSGADFSNQKTGILVEAVEGAETIKAGAGGWKFLSRWLGVTTKSIQTDLHMRSNSEGVGYVSAFLNQISYVGIVAVGSWVVMEGNMTMGGLIACSILGGRILAPITAIPGLIVQRAHAAAATRGLEQLYRLEVDHQGVLHPLTPTQVAGDFILDQVQFTYPGFREGPLALQVARLQINAGERVGILGPIGAGKSTLLRLLSGLYRPQKGRILLDNLDMAHISRQVLSEHIGYLQQDTRLFQGTLRENLLIGLSDPGDDVIYSTLRRSGLIRLVADHPRGLELPIMEGGKGLSGGQRQLVAFTRLLLVKPKIWLLDEPTASMDDELEKQCLAVLREELTPDKTFIVVTHKSSVIPLVDRLIVVANHQIVLDGSRNEVLARLMQQST